MAISFLSGQSIDGNVTIATSGLTDNLILTSTDTSAASAPDIVLYRNAAIADSDTLGVVEYKGKNGMVPSSGTPLTYNAIYSRIADASNNQSILTLSAHKGNGSGSFIHAVNVSAIGANNSATGALLINPASEFQLPQYNLDVDGTAYVSGTMLIGGTTTLSTIANATIDTDKFLVSDTGVVKYRTGAEVLSDIGAAPATGGAYLPLAGGTMTGNTKHNDDVFSYWGNSDDLSIQHNNSGQFAQMKNSTGDLYFTNTADDKDIIFQADNSTNGTETYFRVDGSSRSIVVSAALGVYHNDGVASRFGNAGDLQIYHDGSNSYIKDTGTGDLVINTNLLAIQNAGATETMAKFFEGGTVALYYDDSLSLATTSTGIEVSGTSSTFAGDITVSGGDITLGGTGRIQGIDTVSAGTDAANKTYVDNAVSGLGSGTVTSVATGNGLTGGTITSTGTVSVDYSTGSDNLIFSANAWGSTISTAPYTPYILMADSNPGIANDQVEKVQIEDIPMNRFGKPDSSIDMDTNKIINLETPTNSNDAANKSYVDTAVSGLGSGTVTSVATGNGISGGTITSTGTLTVGAGNGLSQSSTGLLMSGSYTGDFSATGDITADQFISTNNGNGQNYKIGDDAWLGDINVANTMRISGNQNPNNGYITFGNSSNTALGRAGTGALTWGGDFQTTGDITVSGGDITLEGTGRIQGVDTVSSGTDAANKTYVDNAVAGKITGSGTSGQIAIFNGTSSVTSNSGLVEVSTGVLFVDSQVQVKGVNDADYTVAGDTDTGLGSFDLANGVSLVSKGAKQITVKEGSIKFDPYTSTSVATTGSLNANQNNQAPTQDTLAQLCVDPSGNVVRGEQEGTWTFTRAQLNATLGNTLIAAPGTNKAIIVTESDWMVKYSTYGAVSGSQSFDVRQANIVQSAANISTLPGARINEIMNAAQGTPVNPSYGFCARDVPLQTRTYKTNVATTLNKKTNDQLPAGLISISIKLKYRIFDATTF